jgi:hypothetical protein
MAIKARFIHISNDAASEVRYKCVACIAERKNIAWCV